MTGNVAIIATIISAVFIGVPLVGLMWLMWQMHCEMREWDKRW